MEGREVARRQPDRLCGQVDALPDGARVDEQIAVAASSFSVARAEVGHHQERDGRESCLLLAEAGAREWLAQVAGLQAGGAVGVGQRPVETGGKAHHPVRGKQQRNLAGRVGRGIPLGLGDDEAQVLERNRIGIEPAGGAPLADEVSW